MEHDTTTPSTRTMSSTSATHRKYSFQEFTLDIDRGTLSKAGVDIKLRPKSFEVLTYLLERHGKLVNKTELRDAIWGRTIVTDDALAQCLIDIRRALGDADKSIVRTMPKRGYLFDAAVSYSPNNDAGRRSTGNSETRAIWFTTSILLAIVLTSLFWWFSKTNEPARTTASQKPVKSLAVLSFVDMSARQDQQYFADGVAEDLLNLLAKIPDLQVTSRTSAFSFRDENIDIRTVADQLNVSHILEGSVRRDGNRMRITVQLIDTHTDTHVWSATYDRELDDIFAVQDEIVAMVGNKLKLTLLAERGNAIPVNARAYTAMLRARRLLNEYNEEYLPQIESLLQQALNISPDYVLALLELARFYVHQGDNDLLSWPEVMILYRETIDRAYELEPDNAAVHIFLGLPPRGSENDLRNAAPHVVRAMQLDPTNTFVVQWAASYALNIGQFEEAKALGDYVVKRDPLCIQCQASLAEAYLASGNIDAAQELFRTVLLLDSRMQTPARFYIGLTRLLADDTDGALNEFNEMQLDLFQNWGLALAYFQSGRIAEFEHTIKLLLESGDAYVIASTYAWADSKDSAFKWLDIGLQAGEGTSAFREVFRDPLFQNLHDDPRWHDFLEKTGTSPAQLASIDFEISLPE